MSRNEMIERIADLILEMERIGGKLIDLDEFAASAGIQRIQAVSPTRQ